MTVEGTPEAPAGWDGAAMRLWAKGRRAEAVARAREALAAAPSDVLVLQVCYYLFLLNDFVAAATELEARLETSPGNFEMLLNLGVCYSRGRRPGRAVETARRVLELEPGSVVALDMLASGLAQMKRHDEAAEAGTRSLELKDRATTRPKAGVVALPGGSPGEFAGAPGKTNVIAFSLWGDSPIYLRGALRNLLLAPDLYPGWTLRFYVDRTVPAEFLRLIGRLGGKACMQPEGQPLRQRLGWRFHAANDPAVGRFLVRDADAVFSVREVQAVLAWERSDAWFHVMRDWWSHTDLVLAGMWGGVAGVLPPLNRMLVGYRAGRAETPNIDQWFLADRVWPHLRQSCLVHDRCFTFGGAVPFPGPLPAGNRHVGQDEYAANGMVQERLLAPWIAAVPSLGRMRFVRRSAAAGENAKRGQPEG